MPLQHQIYKESRNLFIHKFRQCIEFENKVQEAVKNRLTLRNANEEADFLDDLIDPGVVFDLFGNLVPSQIIEHGGEPGTSAEFYRVNGLQGPVYIDIGRTNESLVSYFNPEIVADLSIREKIIYDAVIATAMTSVKQNEAWLAFQANENAEALNARVENIPKAVFQAAALPRLTLMAPWSWRFSNPVCLALADTSARYTCHPGFCRDALDKRIESFPQYLNNFEQAVITLRNLMDDYPSKADKIAKATFELLIDIEDLQGIVEPAERQERITEIFETYESACKSSGLGRTLLKAAGVVIITGICFTLGVTLCATACGIAGVAAGAWSGPGAAVSGVLGAFSGALTGWTMAAAVSGTLLGALGFATSSYGFFKESTLDKHVNNAVAAGLQELAVGAAVDGIEMI